MKSGDVSWEINIISIFVFEVQNYKQNEKIGKALVPRDESVFSSSNLASVDINGT